MSEQPVVDLEGLIVRYGNVTAVDGLSLAVPRGSVYALLGRNGSGKSSTVRCMLGQHKPDRGGVRILGFEAWRDRCEMMARLGVVPENPDVPPATNAERVERFMAWVSPRWNREEFFSRLERYGVPKRLRFDRLSKGQQRQFALALALSSAPELLVLDDPTLGLDAVARRVLYEELVGDLADRGTTVFLTTHDLAGVEGIADDVGVLKDGALLVDEPVEALKARFCRLIWTESSEMQPERVDAGLRNLDVVASGGGGASGAVVGGFSEENFALFQHEAAVEVTRIEPLSLEEIFIAICGEGQGGS
jgi:ABC-2 type transport system ATP-binding protein